MRALTRSHYQVSDKMILEEATKEAFGYYFWDLSKESTKHILVACELCGEFRITRKRLYRTFCRSCAQRGKKRSEESKAKQGAAIRGEKNHFFGKKHTDKSKALISKNHADFKGRNHPEWKPKIKCICETCGGIFEVWPSVKKEGNGKYCSYSCSTKARRHNKKPLETKPELIFEDICTKHNLPFHFVGDGSLWLGNANPDFIHNTRKLCVEIYGDYWHSPLLNKNIRPNMTLNFRRKQLKAEGYKLIVFWESDLKRKDAEAFVLYELNKHMVL